MYFIKQRKTSPYCETAFLFFLSLRPFFLNNSLIFIELNLVSKIIPLSAYFVYFTNKTLSNTSCFFDQVWSTNIASTCCLLCCCSVASYVVIFPSLHIVVIVVFNMSFSIFLILFLIFIRFSPDHQIPPWSWMFHGCGCECANPW